MPLNFELKIKQFASEKFGTMTALARELGMSLPHLSQYAHLTNAPGIEFFIKLRALGCDLNWLLSDSEMRAVAEPSTHYSADKMKIEELEKENFDLKSQLTDIQKAADLIKKAMNKK